MVDISSDSCCCVRVCISFTCFRVLWNRIEAFIRIIQIVLSLALALVLVFVFIVALALALLLALVVLVVVV